MLVEVPFVGGPVRRGHVVRRKSGHGRCAPCVRCRRKPFGVNSSPWGVRGGIFTTSTPTAVNTASKETVNFAIPVTDKEPERRGPITQIHNQVCGPAVRTIRRSGFAVTPRMCTRRVTTSSPPGRTDAASATVIDRGRSRSRSSPEACPRRKGPPAHVAAAGRWVEARAGEDPPDGAGAEPVAQAEELTLDSRVSPSWILPSQPDDQVLDLVAYRRAAGRFGYVPNAAGRVGDAATTRCPQVTGAMLAQPPGQQASSAREDTPLDPATNRSGLST